MDIYHHDFAVFVSNENHIWNKDQRSKTAREPAIRHYSLKTYCIEFSILHIFINTFVKIFQIVRVESRPAETNFLLCSQITNEVTPDLHEVTSNAL